MKNYKISLFDDEGFYQTYQSTVTDIIDGDKEIVDNHYALFNNARIGSLNMLIFDVYNFKASKFIILSSVEDLVSQMMIEDEVLLDINEPARDRNDLYITEDGVLCSGRCIDFTLSCIPDEKKKDFKYQKYNGKYGIILEKQKEKLYLYLNNIGLNIVGISGGLYSAVREDVEPDGDTYTNYLIKYSEIDKEKFIKKSIVYLEEQIKKRIKGPLIKKLKDNLLQNILKLDEEYGTEGKNIYLKDIDKDVLLLLHLEEKVQILDFKSENEFYVNKKEKGDENNDGYYDKIPPIIEQEIFDKNVKYFSNGNVTFGAKNFAISKLHPNERSGCILLFTMMKKGSRYKLEDYLKAFMANKQAHFPAFSRNRNIKMKTFKDFPSRWNKFSRENDIGVYIQKSAGFLELTSIHPDNRNFVEDIGY